MPNFEIFQRNLKNFKILHQIHGLFAENNVLLMHIFAWIKGFLHQITINNKDSGI